MRYLRTPPIQTAPLYNTYGDAFTTGQLTAAKADQGKPCMSLLPFDVLREVTKVFDYGAHKYAAYNWTKGMRYTRLIDAELRHLTSWLNGQDLDDESGLPHLDHMLCCLLMLRGMVLRGTGEDDRHKVGGKNE